MGRKKKSVRCKTSKRDSTHKDKRLKTPPSSTYPVPLNQMIDQNGKSSQLIRDQILRQNKSRPTPIKHAVSPAIKMKINRFLFGKSPRPNTNSQGHPERAKKNKAEIKDLRLCDDDSKQNYFIESAESKKERLKKLEMESQAVVRGDDSKENEGGAPMEIEEDPPRFDVLELSNLDRRVFHEKIIAKIVNKKLAQFHGVNAPRISLKSISILSAGTEKLAKIVVHRSSAVMGQDTASDIVRLLNGKKLFGKVLKCDFVRKKR